MEDYKNGSFVSFRFSEFEGRIKQTYASFLGLKLATFKWLAFVFLLSLFPVFWKIKNILIICNCLCSDND